MDGIFPPKRLLLHQCCGPCSMWPLEELCGAGVEVTLLFFNPNIHPEMEWERRRDNAEKAAAYYGVPVIVESLCVPGDWRTRADIGDERCRFCYRTRFKRLAEVARERGIRDVSTTLLVSPWQKRGMIIETGGSVCAPEGLRFIPFDWRGGYRRGQNLAREIGLYRQKYCGCVVSLESSAFYETIAHEHETLALGSCLRLCDTSRLLYEGCFEPL